MSKAIIISNRLPIKIVTKKNKNTLHHSEGGLATGLESVFKKSNDNIWVGWPGMVVKDTDAQLDIENQLAEMHLKPIFLSKKQVDGFYLGFSNATLWPIFHYATNYARYNDADWKIYQEVNEKFAEVIIPLVEDGDTIWIHDYHLLLLPRLIKEKCKNVSIGFFQHIPFPSFEIFRLIPWRKQLLDGMLGADLLGFHTIDDVNHFIDSASRLLDTTINSNVIFYKGEISSVDAFPMGIDFEKFNSKLPKLQATQKDVANLKRQFGDTKIVLSIDRLDYSKGILPRIHAFEQFLQKHSEYKGKVTLFMIVVPSRDSIYRYKELKDEIDKVVGDINARFRTLDWRPIEYFYQSFPVEYLSALYQMSDICLVTPMRDGMNLVCKEYVASRNEEDGVLILSEMAGSSRELGDALIVNPNDIGQIEEAIVAAIKMSPKEQQIRMVKMRQIIEKFNIVHWVKIFMEKLREVKKLQTSFKTKSIAENMERLRARYANAQKRVLFFDYDGTLVGFNSNIEKTYPDKELFDILEKITNDPKNKVVIISGRNHETLEKWFGKMNMDLIGEHGVWFKIGTSQPWETINGLNNEWKKTVLPVIETITDKTPGSFIEDKSHSLVWHYRNADNELGKLRANEIMNDLNFIIRNKGLQFMYGDKVVEIKSAEINKGKAIQRWLDLTNYQPDFVFAIGDDVTDEDMFRTLSEDDRITVKVGQKFSKAKYYVEQQKDVRKLLKDMVSL
ncbi:bifunctional alpha,alpha-trehalose-phosphate synthase (UDP-forming)/trehalose-phosphatase [Rhizosphaericola mali]|uniref:Glucosylglycerol-phosphate synthase n=1 Tax=Rhizosphaericola mali TaxID=2545455 RepID=A0A5P2FXL9_9BACT|nr:bifunctional alpha,alpha-trehalose-phosphate synthase (UDP-forming)/trehalose-phosphatase [Rhizosphaericola mali]QES87945.1 bifunctional alpha,alpha-trehalose-phosphate synthase (UDP-forming)/trehalose-phosphatase [Rhizosphaericola mali]